jgi:prefoldin subunit 5
MLRAREHPDSSWDRTQASAEGSFGKALAELKKTTEEISKMLDESIKRLQQTMEQIAPKPKQTTTTTR